MSEEQKTDVVKSKLEAAVEAARKAEEARDIFLANMSHELRTPINTMLGLNELIIRESQDETIKGYAMDIKQAGNILMAMVSDILDFSKLEAGKLELADGIYDISSLLNDLINGISLGLRRKKLDLELDIAKDIPYKLQGDEIRIRQVISNLLSNAVKFTEKGKITLHISWKECEGDELLLQVAVEDTGIGIKEQDMPKLFRAFQKMDSITRSTSERTGLGLAITKNVLQLHHGGIKLNSTPGEGTTFLVRILLKYIE